MAEPKITTLGIVVCLNGIGVSFLAPFVINVNFTSAYKQNSIGKVMEKNSRFMRRGLDVLNLVLYSILAILLIGSCSTNRGGSAKQEGSSNQGSSSADLWGKSKKEAVAESMVFPFVNVPAYITSQKNATEYLVKNFWNGYFNKAEREAAYYSIDSVQFETAYANYAALLNTIYRAQSQLPGNPGMGAYQLVASSQKKLFARADSLYLKGFKLPLMRLIDHSEKYLYDPNSPFLNEEIYIPALEAILALESIDDVAKLAYKYQLEMALLNRVGTKANDFEYKNINGKRSRLHNTKAEYLLIYFNNPDCNSCKGEQQILMSDPLIEQMCARGALTVLAMYIDEQTDLWEKNYKNIPDSWIYARDPHLTLRDNELYGIRAIPSMYLLDKDKRVLLKDASAKQVIDYMKKEVAN